VKEIRYVAGAMRAYAKQAKNKTLEIDAAEIRIRAERRVGELIEAQREAVGLAKPGRKSIGVHETPITLTEAGIDKALAKRARTFAAVDGHAFENLIDEWRRRVQAETERVTVNLLRLGARPRRPGVAVPEGEYRLLYADPPWRYEHPVTDSRAIENQYPTMTVEEICALPVPAAADAVLFLWATSPKLRSAFEVLDAWAFDYRTCAVWDKGTIGMGYYFRQQHELLLVAAKGALPVPDPSERVSSVIRAPRDRVHSRKPVAVVELLEAMYPTFTERDRIELFTRERRPGWAAWGNDPAVAS
jgi:N6-adenosine-specific RNA methylase IME4